MIDVKRAVSIAIRFVDEVLAEQKLIDARLEEVELSNDEKLWYVTLSFLREPKGLAEAIQPTREYKTVTIQSADGKVQSMKIREPA